MDGLESAISQLKVKVMVRTGQGHFAISDHWSPSSDESSIHLVPFESDVERPDLMMKWGKDAEAANQKFNLRLYLPPLNQFEPPYRRLYLLFNGLAEADPAIFDDVGSQLASRGIPCILIPLPMHFTRRYRFPMSPDDPYTICRLSPPGTRQLITQQTLQEIMCDPNRIFHGYRQITGDARSLLRRIKESFHPYWVNLFEREPEVSLFGYSIGGFAALALLLLNPDRYKAVFLLESGVYFDEIDASLLFWRRDEVQKLLWKTYYKDKLVVKADLEVLFSSRERTRQEAFENALKFKKPSKCGFGREPWRVFERPAEEAREIWREIVRTLYESIKSAGKPMPHDEREIFERVCLGYQRLTYKKQLGDLAEKILILAGGADEIFPARLLLQLGPDTGLPLLQLPGLTHWIKERSRKKWLRWLPVMIDFMEGFTLNRSSST